MKTPEDLIIELAEKTWFCLFWGYRDNKHEVPQFSGSSETIRLSHSWDALPNFIKDEFPSPFEEAVHGNRHYSVPPKLNRDSRVRIKRAFDEERKSAIRG